MTAPPTSNFAGLHTPRLEARQKALKAVFSADRMLIAWKDYVRSGLRDQEILDLFDYNDFHWARDERFADLQTAILNGRYKPANSIPTKLEKSLGVCRTVVTPSPEDAVVLQCIVESIIPKAALKQPSKNAFFSRSHQNLSGTFTFGKDYIWFKQWRKFSRLRFQVASAHDWVVTTDIATYFDNIHYSHLRNIISTFDGMEEVILDVLFDVLDSICWRPDYLPSSRIGLPQVQFDAPRLLAHIYLFEIDAFLKERTNDNFVRWVDDITFAVESLEVGKTCLRDLDILLQMRGIRLNSGKTKILSAPQARRFFYQRENEYLDRIKAQIDKNLKGKKSTLAIETKLKTSFDKFIVREKYGHHDKIIKRYIGFFQQIKSEYAIEYCFQHFASDPGLRDSVYRYAGALSPSQKMLTAIGNYLFGGNALDDASMCQIAKLLTDWEIAPVTPLFRSMKKLTERMAHKDYINRDTFRFLAALWMISKYSTQKRLREFIIEFGDVWRHSEFLSRQVAASSGKFRSRQSISWLQGELERHSFRSALSVLNALRDLRSCTNNIPSDVRLYILNGRNMTTYSLQRFLVAISVMSAPNLLPATKNGMRTQLLKYLRDPHYIRVLNAL
ncbi:RNA-directed DNA polymerase [Sphingomonas sp. UNC305MFCol5.2]|uniref:RNA-directed DNA polymerase n=1 Tax=Sphingomonas sp. UNC305MFCol5.2 TaxID=1449076 RepID=UPI0003FCFB37|nr:RNA-directed DNA polymerase [Sphingomonas sp. UNC305MFCol5.2]